MADFTHLEIEMKESEVADTAIKLFPVESATSNSILLESMNNENGGMKSNFSTSQHKCTHENFL